MALTEFIMVISLILFLFLLVEVWDTDRQAAVCLSRAVSLALSVCGWQLHVLLVGVSNPFVRCLSCSQLLCWWFVLDTGHRESFLTLAYSNLIILLILFGFSFVFWPQTFLLAHKKKTAISWQHQCKTKHSKRCSSCCNFFSRLVLNLYSRCDETVNEVHQGVKMVG